MNKSIHWMLILAIALAGVATLYFMTRHDTPDQRTVTAIEQEKPRPAEEAPLMRHPVAETGAKETPGEAKRPLPALQDSDSVLLESLGQLFSLNRFGELFILKDIITRLVVTIDNLPRTKLPHKNLPTLPPPGKFLVTEQGAGAVVISPENDQRYAKHIQFFEAMDARKVVSVYFHFYPLFQEAYSNLGYKSAYFNDRLVAVIDDLLAAPELSGPIRLVQPAVFYKYADPQLEALSAGQKVLIRMGNDNAARVKAKLRELRQALTQRDIGSR